MKAIDERWPRVDEVPGSPSTKGQAEALATSFAKRTPQRTGWHSSSVGYWDTETVQQALQSGAQVLVPPDGGDALEAPEPRQMARNPLAQQMRQVLNTEAGRALYRMRQTVVEPVFGSIKEARRSTLAFLLVRKSIPYLQSMRQLS